MDKKTTDIVAYLTWVGLVIAFVAGDREGSRFHMNQSLVIWLVSTVAGILSKLLGWIPLLGWLIALLMGVVCLFCAVCWFIGLINAIQGVEKEVPLLGRIRLIR